MISWKHDASAAFVERMMGLLAHRGPDGQGIWRDPQRTAVLGHRRLAVIDLSSAAAQPMTDRETPVTITFNGEIYNYIELRRELDERGHVFRPASATEVLLASYLQWGE